MSQTSESAKEGGSEDNYAEKSNKSTQETDKIENEDEDKDKEMADYVGDESSEGSEDERDGNYDADEEDNTSEQEKHRHGNTVTINSDADTDEDDFPPAQLPEPLIYFTQMRAYGIDSTSIWMSTCLDGLEVGEGSEGSRSESRGTSVERTEYRIPRTLAHGIEMGYAALLFENAFT